MSTPDDALGIGCEIGASDALGEPLGFGIVKIELDAIPVGEGGIIP